MSTTPTRHVLTRAPLALAAALTLGLATAPALQAELGPRSQQPHAALIVDLTDVGFIVGGLA